MPRLICTDFLLGWPQTKLPLTPQPARKWFDTKESKMSSSPPTSPQTNSRGMRSERNPHPPGTEFIYLPQCPFTERGGAGNKSCIEAKESLGVALHYRIWQAFASLQLLCILSQNGATQTEQPRSVVLPRHRAPSLQMLMVLQHPVTRLHKKRMLIFTWTRTASLYTSLWPTCTICTSKGQPIIECTAGESHQRGAPMGRASRSQCLPPHEEHCTLWSRSSYGHSN